MSLFSFLRKNKQESASDEGAYYSRAEEDSQVIRSGRKRKQASNSSSTSRRDEPLDPVLPEKKRARRRLIGAIALVLAAVIGLPMILDAEPQPLSSDIAIQIPSRERVTQTEDVQPTSIEAGPAETAVAEPAVEAPASARNAAATPAISAPVAALAAPVPKTTPVTVPAPVEKVSQSTPVRTETPTAIDEGARALALLEGRPDPRAAAKKAEKFVVQVAALASQEKVNELQLRLKDAGIKSYTQKVATQGGDRTRVRVGPFTSREEAEKVRSRIVKLGLNGTLVPV